MDGQTAARSILHRWRRPEVALYALRVQSRSVRSSCQIFIYSMIQHTVVMVTVAMSLIRRYLCSSSMGLMPICEKNLCDASGLSLDLSYIAIALKIQVTEYGCHKNISFGPSEGKSVHV